MRVVSSFADPCDMHITPHQNEYLMIPEEYENVKGQVSYCGLKCEECKMGNGTVAEAAIDLSNYLKMYEVASWASAMPGGKDVDFKQLDENLAWVSKWIRCPGCLKGGGNPECPIRLCAKEKSHDSCGQCNDLNSCRKYDLFGEERGKQMKKALEEDWKK
ncbi:MAG: hypothetical protein A4E32_00314 [Methanomassiliicoccales archaeon PtaU1.Bin124]|nr:MAG: hypothetical protein A4E32_00314 [Methanomassiliicoccales archaeon PtaU1.Bin124]